MITKITPYDLKLHAKWLRGKPDGVQLVTAVGSVELDVCLADADLRCANLRYTNLADADLSGALLSHVDLTGTNLTGTNLRCANLTHAIMRDVDAHRADLKYANLTDVDLTGASHCWLVTGDEVGRGGDDEPLLDNVQLVGEIANNLINSDWKTMQLKSYIAENKERLDGITDEIARRQTEEGVARYEKLLSDHLAGKQIEYIS